MSRDWQNHPGQEGGEASIPQQQQRQQQQHQHDDYDWMGVLDTLEDHFDIVDHDRMMYQQYPQGHNHHDNGHAAPKTGADGAEDVAALSAASVGEGAYCAIQNVAVGQHHHHPEHSRDFWGLLPTEGQGDRGSSDTAAELIIASGSAVNAASSGSEPISAPPGRVQVDGIMQSRVERKRSREKKRRSDINSQFAALAELVKEIDATDLAEEAMFDFNKRYDNNGREEEEEKEEPTKGIETDIDHSPQARSTFDKQDASIADGANPGEKHSKKLKSSDITVLDDNTKVDSSFCSPQSLTTGLKSSSLPSSSIATSSNRIDLIARTIFQLKQLRMVRLRRNTELRDYQRKNCELRKECEGLHRLIAQYKAMGKMGSSGYIKPQVQEKVMMMVPMMVPQESVSHIAASYTATCTPLMPAAIAGYSPNYPYFANLATPHPRVDDSGGGAMSSSIYLPHASNASVTGMHQQGKQQCSLQKAPIVGVPLSQRHEGSHQASSLVGQSNLHLVGGIQSTKTVPTSDVNENASTSGDCKATNLSYTPDLGNDLNKNPRNHNMSSARRPSEARNIHSPHNSTRGTTSSTGPYHTSPPGDGNVQRASLPLHPADMIIEASTVMPMSPAITHVNPTLIPIGIHAHHLHHASHDSPAMTAPHNATQTPHSAPYYHIFGHDHLHQHALTNTTTFTGAQTNYSPLVLSNSVITHAQQQQQQQQQQLQPMSEHHHDEPEKQLLQDTTAHPSGGGNLAHCA